ncbi:MAG: DAK2 domain-containing protein [Anaerolineae bacterium]|jgi:DAK2 domain fusion protein YloV|nr:DAK2 domain-containing protein [Anaerolineae bacterium]MBT7191696.1 DAK2 domain-containing protein [Anaerolineae bacterium]MBT7990057.1 DAK2 domain-containing protein [Anaerolineae bacterium]
MSDEVAAARKKRVEEMQALPFDGQAYKRLVEAGLTWLRANQESVNALNVFPVPDGDTGTNMVLTMQSAYDEIENSGHHKVGDMAAAVSQGALMGARGNSGVILSQIWRGVARGLEGAEVLTGENFARALTEASETAYRGVVRPVEGTILTVSKDIGLAAVAALEETQNPIEILEKVIVAGKESVDYTPELLPVLKDAGVVDSGGMGLFLILEGMMRYIYGEPLDTPTLAVKPMAALDMENAMHAVEEGQDWEVVVDFYPSEELDLQSFYGKLEEMGTSIQVGEGDGMYRMHIHVPLENRYLPIDYIMELGTITDVAMENLVAQMDELNKNTDYDRLELTNIDPGEIAIVTVSPGPGISRIFASLGVAAIVEGGQTMNPSTKELLAAFENLPTDKVIILPNNKNIVLAAQAARDVTVKEVHVVPSRTIPQGLAAMLMHNPEGDLDVVAEKMLKSLDTVRTGEVTTATRTVEIDGVNVETGQVIALLDGKLVLAASSVDEACLSLLEKADMDEYELITLYMGGDYPRAEANRVGDLIQEKYPDHEVEMLDGGQPHYQLILSIE